LLPPAVVWAGEEEQKILSEGVPLLEHELADAFAVGVREPLASQIVTSRNDLAPLPVSPKGRLRHN